MREYFEMYSQYMNRSQSRIVTTNKDDINKSQIWNYGFGSQILAKSERQIPESIFKQIHLLSINQKSKCYKWWEFC
jgi:hypothetical protein